MGLQGLSDPWGPAGQTERSDLLGQLGLSDLQPLSDQPDLSGPEGRQYRVIQLDLSSPRAPLVL